MRPTGRTATSLVATLAGVLVFGLVASAASGAYTVRRGDTLSGIAARHGVSVSDLARANGIGDPDLIFAGRRLAIPGAAGAAAPAPARLAYVVGPGDTLSAIAARHGVAVRALAEANGIDDVHLIRIGSTISIPAPDLTAPAGAGTVAPVDRFPARLRRSAQRMALVPVFEKWASAYGAPADLLMAMTWLESGWQNDVVSSVGAVGIGQLMPATTAFVSDVLLRTRLDPRVPEDNIRMSARFLRWLLDRTGGDEATALAAYYQGLASVRAKGMLPSTVTYTRDVLALRDRNFRAA